MQKRRGQLEKVTQVLDNIRKRNLGGEIEAFKFQKKDLEYREKIDQIECAHISIKDKYDELEAKFVNALEGFEKYAYLEEKKAARNGKHSGREDETQRS